MRSSGPESASRSVAAPAEALSPPSTAFGNGVRSTGDTLARIRVSSAFPVVWASLSRAAVTELTSAVKSSIARGWMAPGVVYIGVSGSGVSGSGVPNSFTCGGGGGGAKKPGVDGGLPSVNESAF